MPILTRTRLVLTRTSVHTFAAIYQQRDDDGALVVAVAVAAATYVDLGRPDTITVTIKPGDTLNPPK